MNRLHQLKKDHSESEELIEEVINAKFNKELNEKWTNKLSSTYGVKKTTRHKTKRKSLYAIPWIRLVAAACIVGLIFSTVFLLNRSKDSATTLASAYIDETSFVHPGLTKGVADNERLRLKGIQAFNAEEYRVAADYFSKIDDPSTSDIYHHAVSLLLIRDYLRAITTFQSIPKNEDLYRQEVNWFLSLSYILSGNTQEAKKHLLRIKKNEWNHHKAQILIQNIN